MKLLTYALTNQEGESICSYSNMEHYLVLRDVTKKEQELGDTVILTYSVGKEERIFEVNNGVFRRIDTNQ